MKQNQLGTTDLQVSEFALGCWAIAGGINWGDQDESDSLAAIHAALDVGMTTLDTAPGYGNGYSEELIGKALPGRRDEAFIATKVSGRDHSGEAIRKNCEESLKRLKTDYVDLLQLHWPHFNVPVEETVEGFKALKQEGKIRAYGVCNFGPRQLEDYLNGGGEASSNQLAYNLVSRAIEFEILPLTKKHGMSILAYSPIMQGLLTEKYPTIDDLPADRQRTRHFSSSRENARHGQSGFEQEIQEALDNVRAIARGMDRPLAEVAMRWLLDRGGVTSVLIGARSAKQVERNARAARDPLPEQVLDALDQATELLKDSMGPNADLWQAGEDSRIR